ncbi:M16 family metallopeptidase [Novosphingobium tardum]|uniref:M16 family metallopeptidase n=1 Tax=Novosphingobium tardum TaxID=1538021 RepID=A0ABV8RMP6_9SPHN
MAGLPEPSPAAAAPAAPLADLVRAVDIPYEQFSLANGLTTLVHTDRKAPIVGVTVYYRVGSKHEPKGRTGFAHLFEHLFFGGSENVPNFDIPLEAAGSTSTNGSTSFDRTNYVETVPTGALDLALFMESDRMGHLLGAVTQDKLDKQRGVVQNEKRQGDNQPYGLIRYATLEGLYPVGHPYRHSTIGSLADLDAASLGDVRKWFTDHYAPNNAVLVLSGDIDAATARPLVQKWFGDIASGPKVVNPPAGPVTLPAPVSREMKDQVPDTMLVRMWSGPGLNDRDALALDMGMRVLGGLSSSRLDNALVRDEQLAVHVSADADTDEQTGVVEADIEVKPGVDRAVAEARFDALIADFIAKGPTSDELRRAATQYVSSQIGELESVGGFGGKGATLAEGLLYSGNPEKYKADLAVIASLTPEEVTAAMQRWLTRPVYKLAIVPGARTEDGAKMGGWGDEATSPLPKPDAKKPAAKIVTGPPRPVPPVLPVGDLAFPAIERATLSNGIPVAFARRTTVPKVLVSMNFDAGFAADPHDALGTQSLMLALLEEGTTTRDSVAIAEEQERLGASINAGASLDSSAITLSALAPNLAPSLALMADVARNPAFAPDQVKRLADQRVAEIGQELASPVGLARRAIAPLIYGADHPYGVPGSGLGDATAVARLTPANLRSAHDTWLRPDLARITVVGDTTLAELLPLLERNFGTWRAPASPRPAKNLNAAIPAPHPRIVVIDRPNSPQSVIVGGRALPLSGRQSNEALELANEVLGNGFLSRLNLDLREDKGWSYGVRSGVSEPLGTRALTVSAPVQADRTGDALKLLIADMKALPAKRGVDQVELNRVTDGNIRGLPNRFETSAQILSAIIINDRLGRPDDYYATLPTRYRAIGATEIDAAARQYLQPDDLVFVVVGDRKVIDPQLKGVGLPVEYAPAIDSNVGND